MRVAVIAPPEYPVPPLDGYGGIERGAFELARGIAEQGHQATLLASGDSVFDVPGVGLLPIVYQSCGIQNLSGKAHARALEEAQDSSIKLIASLVQQGSVDVVNLRWEEPRLARELGRLPVPLIVSFSCTPNRKIETLIDEYQPHVVYTAHSRAHKRALGDHGFIKVVPYGVSMEDIKPSHEPLAASADTPSIPLLQRLQAAGRNYVLHLATITRGKGQVTSIEMAKKANVPLILAGAPNHASPESLRYFQERVYPHIDDESVYYFGLADEREKYELMRHALATLFCSGVEANYAEAFGRALAESAAVGTPIVGYRAGSFPELIEEGVTGLGFDTVSEAVTQLKRVNNKIERFRCAERARLTMSSERFIRDMTKLCLNLVYHANPKGL